MGWRFRKSFGVGPFRTTVSKKGVGNSIGFLGFCFGSTVEQVCTISNISNDRKSYKNSFGDFIFSMLACDALWFLSNSKI